MQVLTPTLCGAPTRFVVKSACKYITQRSEFPSVKRVGRTFSHRSRVFSSKGSTNWERASAPAAGRVDQRIAIGKSLNGGNSSVSRIRSMATDVAADAPVFTTPRTVVRTLLSKEQPEGDGARVRRSIGRPEMKTLDPFLLLDHFAVSPPAGFPDHPHRGFETVTYMIEGKFTHQDFAGHSGTIGPGDLQWMTAGRGIVHCELPAAKGVQKGLQLWVNLAGKDKMVDPNYQELEDKDVPKVEKDGVRVSVIAGESYGVKSPVYTRTPTMYLDFTVQPGSKVAQAIPEGWNAFLYILEGKSTFGTEDAAPIDPFHTVELSQGDGLLVWNKSNAVCRFVLIGGQPLNEPVVQYGPFVMNTKEEIMETIKDYQLGRNGFERAQGWESSPVLLA